MTDMVLLLFAVWVVESIAIPHNRFPTLMVVVGARVAGSR
jgi:hypothetical protein